MNVQDVIKEINASLAHMFSPSECQSIVRIIFDKLLRYSTVDIILKKDEPVSDFIKGKIDEVVDRLLHNQPIQYIFGEAYFHGIMLKVSPDVLIPRPETEELVDMIVGENSLPDLRVLDIGTGSGAIAVALARSLRFPSVSAIDISPNAIAIARENASKLKVKVNFIIADILKDSPSECVDYDIIVSNPPYVTESERASMEPNVLNFEPELALFVPDDNPLVFYRAIARFAIKALKAGGRIYFEINQHFGAQMEALLAEAGFVDIDISKDMHGNDRFASASKPSENDF